MNLLHPSAAVSRVARLLSVVVFTSLIGSGLTLRAQTGSEPAQVLPRVDVSAGVPLVKVGDFKLREARFAPAAVADGDYIYIIGGQDTARAALGSIERFDVRTGQSEEFARLKTGRFWHQAVVADGKIYVLGGVNGQLMHMRDTPPSGDLLAGRRAGQNTPSQDQEMEAANVLEASVEIVDLATRQVSAGVAMPDARAQFGSALIDGKIYVLGGRRLGARSAVRTNDVQIFDIKRGKWAKGAAMPVPGDMVATVVAPGVIVVAGGFDGDRPRHDVAVYNPGDKLWRVLPPLHRDVSSHSLVFLGHHLFLFGDYRSPSELVAYDLVTKRSEGFAFNFQKAWNPAALVHENKIYVVGGRVPSDAESVDAKSVDYIQVYALPEKN